MLEAIAFKTIIVRSSPREGKALNEETKYPFGAMALNEEIKFPEGEPDRSPGLRFATPGNWRDD